MFEGIFGVQYFYLFIFFLHVPKTIAQCGIYSTSILFQYFLGPVWVLESIE